MLRKNRWKKEYRICEYSLCRRISIAVPSFWRLQIVGPSTGTSSSSYTRRRIRLLPRFEPDLPFWGSGGSLCLSQFPRLILGVGFPPLSSPFDEKFQASLTCALDETILWCNMFVNKFATTGDATCVRFQPSLEAPASFPFTSLCGAPGGGLSSACMIYDPCAKKSCKINICKQN